MLGIKRAAEVKIMLAMIMLIEQDRAIKISDVMLTRCHHNELDPP